MATVREEDEPISVVTSQPHNSTEELLPSVEKAIPEDQVPPQNDAELNNETASVLMEISDTRNEVVESYVASTPILWSGLSPSDEELFSDRWFGPNSALKSAKGPVVKSCGPCSLASTPPFWLPTVTTETNVTHTEGRCLHVELNKLKVPLPAMGLPKKYR